MKNIKIYLLMATLVFSTTACLDKYPDDMVPTRPSPLWMK